MDHEMSKKRLILLVVAAGVAYFVISLVIFELTKSCSIPGHPC